MSVNIGNNYFTGVPFPLVLYDRFFHIYEDGKSFNLDVFRWDETTKSATYEVLAGKPQNEEISTNPTGIVTFANQLGVFLFKFRPKPGVSQIFGQVPVDDLWEVRISDRKIEVYRGETLVVTLERDQMTNMKIGLQLFPDGSLAIGVNRLPDGMQLVPRI
ncbi:MAG: hypothetical protein GEU75_11135 [Dehalococcoidia bacterium]|nr:hypothetical protein [Dehalococcoidia bacterium]